MSTSLNVICVVVGAACLILYISKGGKVEIAGSSFELSKTDKRIHLLGILGVLFVLAPIASYLLTKNSERAKDQQVKADKPEPQAVPAKPEQPNVKPAEPQTNPNRLLKPHTLEPQKQPASATTPSTTAQPLQTPTSGNIINNGSGTIIGTTGQNSPINIGNVPPPPRQITQPNGEKGVEELNKAPMGSTIIFQINGQDRETQFVASQLMSMLSHTEPGRWTLMGTINNSNFTTNVFLGPFNSSTDHGEGIRCLKPQGRFGMTTEDVKKSDAAYDAVVNALTAAGYPCIKMPLESLAIVHGKSQIPDVQLSIGSQ